MSTTTPEEDRYMKSLAEADQAWLDYTKHPTDDTWEYFTDAAAEERNAAIAWASDNPDALTTIRGLSPKLFAHDSLFFLEFISSPHYPHHPLSGEANDSIKHEWRSR